MRKLLLGSGLFVVLLLSACSSSSDVQSKEPNQTEKAEEKTQPSGDGSTKLLTTINYPEAEEYRVEDHNMVMSEKGDKVFFGSQKTIDDKTHFQQNAITSDGKWIRSSDLINSDPDKFDCTSGVSSTNGRYWAFNCQEDKAAFSIYDFNEKKIVYKQEAGFAGFTLELIKSADLFAISNKGEVLIGGDKLLFIINGKNGKVENVDLTKKLDTDNGINRIYIDEDSQNLILETDDQIIHITAKRKKPSRL